MMARGMLGNQIRGATVVVTGATSGIGYETAKAFAAAGARVVAAGRRSERLDELSDAITRQGGEALGVPTDVTDAAQVEALVQRAVERFGTLDVIVNNAGMGFMAAFMETT